MYDGRYEIHVGNFISDNATQVEKKEKKLQVSFTFFCSTGINYYELWYQLERKVYVPLL
jgi:hypothetical protein